MLGKLGCWMLANALTVSEIRLVERLVPARFPFVELVGTSRRIGVDRTGWSPTS